MKDLELVDEEPTVDELEKYKQILDVEMYQENVNQTKCEIESYPTRLAIDCIDCLTRLLSTNVVFNVALQGAIDKQLTKFVKALTIETKGEDSK